MTRALIGLLAAFAFPQTVMAEDLNLDWMAGAWRSTGPDPVIEESWTDGSSGLMLGVNQTVMNGRAVAFEFLRIESDLSGARFCAQPGGGTATCFDRVSQGEQEVRFENPGHDFPQVIEYWRRGDRLTARIADLTGETDMIFHWHRVRD